MLFRSSKKLMPAGIVKGAVGSTRGSIAVVATAPATARTGFGMGFSVKDAMVNAR
jgi:hypothetical protein